MENNNIKYLSYLERSNLDGVSFYDFINEGSEEYTAYKELDQSIYNRNSEDSKKNLESINLNNFNQNFKNIFKFSTSMLFYGNPRDIIPMISGIDEYKAKEVVKWFNTTHNSIIDKIAFGDTTKNNITEVKKLSKKQDSLLTKEQIYEAISSKSFGNFSTELGTFMSYIFSDKSIMKEKAWVDFETKYKSVVTKPEDVLEYIRDNSASSKNYLNGNKIKNIIPSYKKSPNANPRLAFATIFVDCFIYLFVNSIKESVSAPVATATATKTTGDSGKSRVVKRVTSQTVAPTVKRTKSEIRDFIKGKFGL